MPPARNSRLTVYDRRSSRTLTPATTSTRSVAGMTVVRTGCTAASNVPGYAHRTAQFSEPDARDPAPFATPARHRGPCVAQSVPVPNELGPGHPVLRGFGQAVQRSTHR